jgi:hypothetical protein
LGEKASKDNRESDIIAVIRTIIFITYLITNSFIVAGVIRHWNRPAFNQNYSKLSKEPPVTLP